MDAASMSGQSLLFEVKGPKEALAGHPGRLPLPKTRRIATALLRTGASAVSKLPTTLFEAAL